MALPKLARCRGNGLLLGVITLLLLVLVSCGGPNPVTNPTQPLSRPSPIYPPLPSMRLL
jgi:hypothetical protein